MAKTMQVATILSFAAILSHAAPVRTKILPPPACGTYTCATLKDGLGDTYTLRPDGDNIAIKSVKNPANFVTMKNVPLITGFGECGDYAGMLVSGDWMKIVPDGNGAFVLTLTARYQTQPRAVVSLSPHYDDPTTHDSIIWLAGHPANDPDFEYAVYLYDTLGSNPSGNKIYRVELFDQGCTAPRPEQKDNVKTGYPTAPAVPRMLEGPIGQGGEPKYP